MAPTDWSRKKDRLPDGDDGRTVVSMNVEGMPWYQPEGIDPLLSDGQERKPGDGLTKRQIRMYTLSALKAGLLVALAMIAGMVLFIAFCVYVWFR